MYSNAYNILFMKSGDSLVTFLAHNDEYIVVDAAASKVGEENEHREVAEHNALPMKVRACVHVS